MNARHPTQRLGAREDFCLGALRVQLIPHFLPGVGPRVFVTLTESPESWVGNLPPAQLRELADRLKLAACEAEALARRARPVIKNEKPAAPIYKPSEALTNAEGALPIFLRQQAD